MATIAENLQIIADSTKAIKQAITDKGGDASGDITTWAEAISGISGGGGTQGIEGIEFSLNSGGVFTFFVKKGTTWEEYLSQDEIMICWDMARMPLFYASGARVCGYAQGGSMGDIQLNGTNVLLTDVIQPATYTLYVSSSGWE